MDDMDRQTSLKTSQMGVATPSTLPLDLPLLNKVKEGAIL